MLQAVQSPVLLHLSILIGLICPGFLKTSFWSIDAILFSSYEAMTTHLTISRESIETEVGTHDAD